MVFHILAPLAYMAAREGLRRFDKKLDAQHNRKLREKRDAEEAEAARIQKALDDQKARKEAEDRARRLEEELKDIERFLKEADRVRKQIEIEEAAQREREALVAERIRMAEIAELNRQALEKEAQRVKAEKDAADALERQRVAEEKLAAALKAQKDAEAALLAGIPPEVRPTPESLHEFRKKYGYQMDKLHIAVVGDSGMGKSTFLNSVRGLEYGDTGFATASLNECTMEVTRYEDPRRPDLVWYDVPGANTLTFTGWTYFMDQGLYAFDVLVLVFCDRFSQLVGTLLKNAKTCNKPVFLVRTKADQLMGNLQYDTAHPVSDDDLKTQVVEMTRDTVRKNMELISMPSDLDFYLVSRKALGAYAKEGCMLPLMIHEKKLLDDICANKKVN